MDLLNWKQRIAIAGPTNLIVKSRSIVTAYCSLCCLPELTLNNRSTVKPFHLPQTSPNLNLQPCHIYLESCSCLVEDGHVVPFHVLQSTIQHVGYFEF